MPDSGLAGVATTFEVCKACRPSRFWHDRPVLVVGVLLVLAVVAVAVAVAMGRGDRLGPATVDRSPAGLPAGPIGPADVADVRFNLALRGYRMAEVDAVLDRLAAELAERDARLVELRGLRAAEPPQPPLPA